MIVWHVETSSAPRFEWARDEEHLRQQVIEYNNTVLNEGDADEQLDDDAELEEAIDKIEERENFSREDMDGAYLIEPRERDTILAALRVYDDWRSGRPTDREMIEEIESNGGLNPLPGLSASELDALCERINI